MKLLILMRGISSSGKSTRANELMKEALESGLRVKICSTDHYFMKEGQYCFDPSKLPDNHAKNEERARGLMAEGMDVVIIDNTNIRPEWYAHYIELARKLGYEVEQEIVWVDLETALRRNQERPDRNIPEEVIRRQYEDFMEFVV